MAHKRSLSSTQAGPSSVNRFIIPAEHTGAGAAVLAQPDLRQTKEAAQAPILQTRGGDEKTNKPRASTPEDLSPLSNVALAQTIQTRVEDEETASLVSNIATGISLAVPSIPTQLASLGAAAFEFSREQSVARARKEQVKRITRSVGETPGITLTDAGKSPSLRVAKQTQQEATIKDRDNTGRNAPGGGRGRSPTGGDVSGTPF